MKKILGLMCILLMSSPLLAEEVTTPTQASKPVPTLSATQNPDTVLTEKVQKVIAETPALKGQAVSAVSQDGIVTLQGSVANKEQEQAAIKAAKSVMGINKVESQLTITLTP